MAVKATAATRAPHGTRLLVQAFFSAAGDIPETRRPDVIKAALAAIRDRLKSDAAEAKATKAASKAARKSPRAAAPPVRKPAVRRAAKAAVVAETPTVPEPKRPRKSPAKRASPRKAEATVE